MAEYYIAEDSDLVSSGILQDEYGITCLELTGIKDGASLNIN